MEIDDKENERLFWERVVRMTELGRVVGADTYKNSKRFGCCFCGQAERDRIAKTLKALRAEIRYNDSLIMVLHERLLPAVKAWQRETNRPDILPDLGRLVRWLLARAGLLQFV
jgi:hypothetical protein